MSNINERGASIVAVLLLSADAVFIALHSMNELIPFLDNRLLSLEEEQGYGDVFQYVKWFWIVLLLVYVSIRRRSLLYVSWALVFAYLLCDDALSIHQTVGLRLASVFGLTPRFGLRPQDFGELAVTAAAGTILLGLVAWAYWRGSQAFRSTSRDLLLLVLALVFFGVIVDMVHAAIRFGSTGYAIMGTIEDGGEMVVTSLMVWYAFLLSVRDEDAHSYLWDSLPVARLRHSAWGRARS